MNQNIAENQSLFVHKSSYSNEKIKIYVRINQSKRGTDFLCSSQISESNLAKLLQKTICQNNLIADFNELNPENIDFVLQGHQIDCQGQNILQLRQLSIIHAIDSNNVNKQKINVTLRYQDLQENKDIFHKIQVNSSQIIAQSIKQVVPREFNQFLNEVSLIYMGRQISEQKTFHQASVQNQSQIIIIRKLQSGNLQENYKQAQEILPEDLGLKFNRIKVMTRQDSISEMGKFDMPYNPKIAESKIKKLLQQNIQANMMQIQQQQNNYNWIQYQPAAPIPNLVPANLGEHEMNLPVQQEKMDSEKDIPTKEEIQEQKNSKKSIQIQKQDHQ